MQASNQGLVFLVTNPHPEAILLWVPTRVAILGQKDAPITQQIPRDLGTLCKELGQGHSPFPLSLRKTQGGFSELCAFLSLSSKRANTLLGYTTKGISGCYLDGNYFPLLTNLFIYMGVYLLVFLSEHFHGPRAPRVSLHLESGCIFTRSVCRFTCQSHLGSNYFIF